MWVLEKYLSIMFNQRQGNFIAEIANGIILSTNKQCFQVTIKHAFKSAVFFLKKALSIHIY